MKALAWILLGLLAGLARPTLPAQAIPVSFYDVFQWSEGHLAAYDRRHVHCPHIARRC